MVYFILLFIFYFEVFRCSILCSWYSFIVSIAGYGYQDLVVFSLPDSLWTGRINNGWRLVAYAAPRWLCNYVSGRKSFQSSSRGVLHQQLISPGFPLYSLCVQCFVSPRYDDAPRFYHAMLFSHRLCYGVSVICVRYCKTALEFWKKTSKIPLYCFG